LRSAPKLPWAAYFTVWAAALIPSVLFQLRGLSFSGAFDLTLERALYSAFIAFTCFFAAAIGYRFPISRARFLRASLIYVVSAVIAVWLQKSVTSLIRDVSPLGQDTDYAGPLYFPYIVFANLLISGNAIRLAARSARIRERIRRMEQVLSGTELQSLEVRLDADDVFRSLSKIQNQAATDPDAALNEIASLGDRLRIRLERSTEAVDERARAVASD
jgi:hypothetical protein